MSEPSSLHWGIADPSYIIEPSAGKKALGWQKGEKPPYQFMNWIHEETALWMDYLAERVRNAEPVIIRSDNSVSWNGSQLSFTGNIQIIFRKDNGAQINQLQSGLSPIALSDGQVLVVKRDRSGASPVNLSSGSYGSLAAGQYAILSESSLTGADVEDEMILFRRRGSNLEIPYLGKTIRANAVSYLSLNSAAESYVADAGAYYSSEYTEGVLQEIGASLASLGASASVAVPIGTIIPFYDYNGALTFNSAIWAYCDGQTKTFTGIGAQATPDLSGRYLVGFGTDGGGDNDSAAWATAAVGNAGHTVNLQHSHTVNSHTHTGPTHTHTFTTGAGSSHQHTINHTHGIFTTSTDGDHIHGLLYSNTPTGTPNIPRAGEQPATNSDLDSVQANGDHTHTVNITAYSGSSGSESAHTHSGTTASAGSSGSVDTGATAPGTDSQLSATQSIQPRSLRVRFLIRYA